jgi:superoxide dismutase, Fe-Mn family
MKSNDGGEPSGSIADAIKTSFGSFSDFKEKFSSATAVIGSGWGRLVYNLCQKGRIQYNAKSNKSRTEGLIPFLGCDVW